MDDIPLDDIAGDINVPQDEDALGTLDEPVSTTLVRRQPPCVLNVSLCVQKRDMKAILYKCRHVIIPGRSKALLHMIVSYHFLMEKKSILIFFQGTYGVHYSSVSY